MLISYRGHAPSIPQSAFIADGVQLIGDVTLGEDCSVWYNAVLRGDLAPIRIGNRSNIQDGCIGHVNTDQPLLVGDDVSVGHGAIIHGCTIGDGSLIGMGAIILNGASIGEYSLIAAGALVTENKVIPPYSLVMGTPGRVVRQLTDTDLERLKRTTASYVDKGREFKKGSGNE